MDEAGEFDIGQALRDREALDKHAERVLGQRGWRLLCTFGRVMAGPATGLYVSALAAPDARQLVDSLARGDEVLVHLMHRHRSGCYESSSLRLQDGQLVMRFAGREEIA